MKMKVYKKTLDNVGNIFHKLYYIYKDKNNEEKKGLNTKDTKKYDYIKLRLTDDYQYESEKEKEQQASKKLGKKGPIKKPTNDDCKELDTLVTKEEAGINLELFKKYFNFQRPSDMLKVVYIIYDKKKNNDLVSVIDSGLGDLKNEIKGMSDKVKEGEKPNKIVDIVEKIRRFNKQKQEGQGLKILTPRQMLSRLRFL